MLELNNPALLREQAYINGQWTDADNGETFEVTNPANGSRVASVPNQGVAETRAAIEAANAAWPEWRSKTAKQRAAILRRWYELMLSNQDDLARLMTAEQGKPLAESAGEVAYGASFVEWFAEEGKRVYGDVIPTHMDDRRILVIKQPVGVVACITPWNFPNAMITRKAGPALAAGCTIVIKPASETPLSALALAELRRRLLALLHEALEQADHLGLLQGSAGVDLPVPDRRLRHPQHARPQRVPRLHRRLQVRFDPLHQGHQARRIREPRRAAQSHPGGLALSCPP